MRQLNNIPNLTRSKINFWINDIGLFVPPTSISVHKEGLNYSIKSLRTKSSVKIASGNGIYHIQLNLVFPPDSIIQLHRLICQVKNNPFLYIENDFIKDTLDIPEETIKLINNRLMTTMMGLNITNNPSSPGTFNVELDLRLFNNKPYFRNLGFKKDSYNYLVADSFVRKISFDIFDMENVINVLEETTIEEKINSIRSKRKDDSFLLEDEGASEKVSSPKDSFVYKRYCNWLQIRYLRRYFNISLERQRDGDPEGFVINEEGANIYIDKRIAEDLNSGVLGLHEIFIPDIVAYKKDEKRYDTENKDKYLLKLRQEIIHAMYLTSKYTRFHARTFGLLRLDKKITKDLEEWMEKDISSGMSRDEKAKIKHKNLAKLIERLNAVEESVKKETPKGGVESFLGRTFETDSTESRDVSQEGNTFPIVPKRNYGDYIDPFKKAMFQEEEHKEQSTKYAVTNLGVTPYFFMPFSGYVKITSTEDNKVSILCSKESNSEEWLKIEGVLATEQIKASIRKNQDRIWPSGSWLGTSTETGLKVEISLELLKKLPFYKKIKSDTSKLSDSKKKKKDSFKKLKDLHTYLAASYQNYAGRESVKGVFESERVLSFLDFPDYEIYQISNLEDGMTGLDLKYGDNTLIANVNGSLKHIVASIPILGQESPTHQFLGSIEPSFQFSFIGKSVTGGLPVSMRELEKMRKDNQEYAKTMSMIPDASNIAVESFITKLLGSYEKGYRKYLEIGVGKNQIRRLIEKYGFSTHSMDTFTLEGQPGSFGLNLRVEESRTYNEEEIRPAFSTEYNKQILNDFYNELNDVYVPSVGPGMKSFSTDAALYQKLPKFPKPVDESEYWGKWQTKYFSPDDFYSKSRPRAKASREFYMNGYELRDQVVNPDRCAYYICDILSQIQEYINVLFKGRGIEIFSSLRFKTEPYVERKSNHLVGGATDIRVEGVNVTELAIYIYFMQVFGFIKDPVPGTGRTGRFLGLGIYGINSHNKSVVMNSHLKSTGFVHVDIHARVIERNINSSKSYYVPGGFPNKLRYWYGVGDPNTEDKYQKGTLPLWTILNKYKDRESLNISNSDNQKLNSFGFENLQTYIERLLAAHKKIQNGTSAGEENLKTKIQKALNSDE